MHARTGQHTQNQACVCRLDLILCTQILTQKT